MKDNRRIIRQYRGKNGVTERLRKKEQVVINCGDVAANLIGQPGRCCCSYKRGFLAFPMKPFGGLFVTRNQERKKEIGNTTRSSKIKKNKQWRQIS